jgi:hypothetical protein
MSSVVISGDTSGAITLAAPAVAGTNTITLPAATGTVMVSGNMPTFSATISADQTVTTAVWTKMQFNTEQFDTNSNFDSSTNYRFTPTVAGYYQINLVTSGGTSAQYQSMKTSIYKNGSSYALADAYLSSTYIWSSSAAPSAVIYFNGSTDYVEGYINITGSGTLVAQSGGCRFSGILVRTA